MNKKIIGDMCIAFGVISSLFSVFRLYHYFFVGHDFGNIPNIDRFPVTMGMIIVTGISYLVGYGIKGKL